MDPSSGESAQSPIERYYDIRAKRLSLQREAAALEAEEKVLAYELFKSKPQSHGYTASYWEEDTPFVNHWPSFLDWLRDNDALDCLQKRLTNSAIMARLKDGVSVPGVEVLKKPQLKVEKNG